MIVLLRWIGSLIGATLTLAMTEEARRWAVRAAAISVMVVATVGAYGGIRSAVQGAMNQAATFVQGAVGGDTLAWIRCVTPTTMPDAISVVVTLALLVAAFRFGRWVVERQFS